MFGRRGHRQRQAQPRNQSDDRTERPHQSTMDQAIENPADIQ
jgi:hypothetical protein